ncbi:hypothetical protein Hypma_001436 [Hypsizygus marmoreus]|uniref:Prolyl 4-hydroxylase alpha subunit Fe(2+) 2OG dioxygenase domain-containing protein n=1 Tax=Hypsizygus marmoreus TaxID=39966 RepID=A0A369K926_HYPMA|nr:hypothetical protein Hypma_001436 [Hypsizygus marmoreus]
MTSLDALRAAISAKPPYCTGTIPANEDNSVLYYQQQERAQWIDLSRSTEGNLKALAQACEPATFGMDQHDVLDESYRKARKMDRKHFASSFDIGASHLIERIRAQLLDARDNTKNIKAELYKLNVYGKDSFFKSHLDTPLSDTMFGSLVLVFPTQHEGGALVLRHGGQEWAFDSAAVLRDQVAPSIAYIAFFSDIDHEVTAVTSGYRVTLTYNLFFEHEESDHLASGIVPVAFKDVVFRTALSAALEDPDFLPKGGRLGFGLSTPMLKGNDSVIKHVCEELKLPSMVNAIYESRECDEKILIDKIIDMPEDEVEDGLISKLVADPYYGTIISELGNQRQSEWYHRDEDYLDKGEQREDHCVEVLWVTPLTTYSYFDSPYIAYGNQASLDYAYGNLCLTAKVGPYGNRIGGSTKIL